MVTPEPSSSAWPGQESGEGCIAPARPESHTPVVLPCPPQAGGSQPGTGTHTARRVLSSLATWACPIIQAGRVRRTHPLSPPSPTLACLAQGELAWQPKRVSVQSSSGMHCGTPASRIRPQLACPPAWLPDIAWRSLQLGEGCCACDRGSWDACLPCFAPVKQERPPAVLGLALPANLTCCSARPRTRAAA